MIRGGAAATTGSHRGRSALPSYLASILFLFLFLTSGSTRSSSPSPGTSRPRHIGDQHPSSPIASPLDDYALADFVILSGIDGSLTAVDRATGVTRWTLSSNEDAPRSRQAESSSIQDSVALSPLVSSLYGKRRDSLATILADSVNEAAEDQQDDYAEPSPLDGLPSRTRHLLNQAGMYVVEPGSSGRLYLLTAPSTAAEHTSTETLNAARLQRLPLTLPQLVNLSPFSFPGDKSRIFTGSKHTRLLRLDVFTGQLDRSWQADGTEISNLMNQYSSEEQDNESLRWTYLARTDYTLSIQIPRRPHLSQTLYYSSYSSQSSDGDVAARWVDEYQQFGSHSAADVRAVLPDGLDRDGRGSAKVSGWNVSHEDVRRQTWTRDVRSQIVDVFDLLVPNSRQARNLAQMHPVVVPHPPFALAGESGFEGSFDDDDVHSPMESDETLVTLSPDSGSLYALSHRRFPMTLRDIKPALAGLSDEQRSSRELVPGSSRHDPMQCRTFGCWIGRYHVDEDHSRGPLSDIGRLGIEGSRGRGNSPLGIADRAANPDAEGRATGNIPSGRSSLQRVRSALTWPSRKVLITQLCALALLAGLSLLVRRGLAEQESIHDTRSQALIQQLGLQWSSRATDDRVEEGTAPVSATNGHVQTPDKQQEDETTPTDILTTEPELTEEERRSRAESTAADLIASEEKEEAANLSKAATKGAAIGNDLSEEPAKKKKRRRGKRAGAAVRDRQAENGKAGKDSGSEKEDEEAAIPTRPVNGDLAPSSERLEEGWIQTGPESKSARDQLLDLAATGGTSETAAVQQQRKESALEISDEILGYGSSGTVVFKGRFQSRLVAVKRLLVDFVHLASQEISLLESADDHPNVIRYFYKEQIGNFLFIALELCPASLADLVEKPDEWRDLAVKLEPKKAISQIASGLRHLHALSIVHRDIKPQNILVAYSNPHAPTTSPLKMLLSDFGLSKRLDSVAQSSFSQTMHHPGGTAGWRAPEILRGEVNLDDTGATTSSTSSSLSSIGAAKSLMGSSAVGQKREKARLTRAVDIFAFGCLSYYLLTSGDHPFGSRYEREVNIMRNQASLSRLAAFGEEGFEASHLIHSMIQPEPSSRPRALQVLAHPYFWDSAKRLSFLQDVSDRLEVVEREKAAAAAATAGGTSVNGTGNTLGGTAVTNSTAGGNEEEKEILHRLESRAKEVTAGGDWTKKVDKAFMDDLGKWRKYHGHSVRDLLRALRNKKHHYQDMPPALRRSMGTMPEGFLSYFTRRFPKLFLHVYEVVATSVFIRTEATFQPYFAQQDRE